MGSRVVRDRDGAAVFVIDGGRLYRVVGDQVRSGPDRSGPSWTRSGKGRGPTDAEMAETAPRRGPRERRAS